jgi:glutamyl-tRNA synthetase
MDLNTINQNKVVTRFAPSPTGFLHVGSIRTALYAYLWAKKHNGTFILRIEDTDKSREVPGSLEHLQESLKWLGINWDYGPDKPGIFGSCIQSERLPIYKKYAESLIAKGLAYADPYTEEELATFREQAITEKRPFLYREHRPINPPAWDGTKPLRLKVPEIKRYTWNDAVRGELSAGEEMLDDLILIKSDGYPTYNFAHIIDDHEMGVTHIMRADEFISSQPKFLSIYDALGFTYPVFVTLPPIMRDDRTKKLGKRDGAKDILDYKADGYLPEAMVNFLALIGWNPGTDQEIFSVTELIEAFDISKIQRAGAAFNEEKLLWMNKQHLLRKTPEQLLEYVTEALPESVKALSQYSIERVEKLVPNLIERIQVATDIKVAAEVGEYDFAFTTPEYATELLLWKNDTDLTQVKPRLEEAKKILANSDFTSAESIKAALWNYAETVGKGEIFWPLRVCLSGKKQSPDPFTIAFIIGQVETIKRIEKACDKIGK